MVTVVVADRSLVSVAQMIPSHSVLHSARVLLRKLLNARRDIRPSLIDERQPARSEPRLQHHFDAVRRSLVDRAPASTPSRSVSTTARKSRGEKRSVGFRMSAFPQRMSCFPASAVNRPRLYWMLARRMRKRGTLQAPVDEIHVESPLHLLVGVHARLGRTEQLQWPRRARWRIRTGTASRRRDGRCLSQSSPDTPTPGTPVCLAG